MFTAGVGENSPEIRSRIANQLRYFEISIDEAANQSTMTGVTDLAAGKTGMLVVPTNEELAIAKQVAAS